MPLNKTGVFEGKPKGNPETAEGQGGDKQRSIRRQNEAADALAYHGYSVEHCPEVKPEDGLAAIKDAPDYRIEGIIFDCYAPLSTLPSNPLIYHNELTENDRQKIGSKVREILTLYTLARMEQREKGEFDEWDDDIANTSYDPKYQQAKLSYALANIHGHVRDKVKAGQTRNVVINLTDSICNPEQLGNHFFDNRIEQLRNIIIVKPREDATPIKAYYSKEKTYGIYRPQNFTIKEYNII